MSWNGESKDIKQALLKEKTIHRELCPLCREEPAIVTCRSYNRGMFKMVGIKCAKKFIDENINKPKELTLGDMLLEKLLYCDNDTETNYGSTKIYQQKLFDEPCEVKE